MHRSTRFSANRPRSGLFGLFVSIALSLSGCADFSGLHPQATLKNETSLDAGESIQQALTPIEWPHAEWWKHYNDLQLNRLVEQAIADNPDLQVAQSRLRGAVALAETARQATLPNTSVTASTTRELFTSDGLYPAPLGGNWDWSNSAEVKASYDLDLWGRDDAALQSAIGSMNASKAETRSAQLSLELAVTRTYLKLAAAHVAQDLIRLTLAEQQSIVSVAQRAFNAGVGTRLDLTEAQASIPSSMATDKRLTGQILLLHNQLAELVGHGPGLGDRITRPTLSDMLIEDNTSQDFPIGVPAQLPAHLVGRRPDIIAQRWRVESAARNIDVAQARFYPDINLSAFSGFESIGLSHFLTSDSEIRGVTPAISLPIFETGRLRANLSARDALYDEAVQTYNQKVIAALQAVSDQIVTMRSETDQQVDLRRGLQIAQQAYNLAERGYRAGLTPFINTAHAQITLLQARQRLIQSRTAYFDSWSQLMQALGGGLGDDLSLPTGEPPRTETSPAIATVL